ncbi:MAG: YmdB family metallophosphoesterase [Magnetospirillum sp. WYHS-4]
MKILFCGDVMGKTGRKAVLERVPELRRKLDLDFVAVNAENAAHGFGITPDMVTVLLAADVDVLTTGNHVWDKREVMNYIDGEPRLLRPINYPPGTPGKGFGVFPSRDGGRVLVINPMGRLFMDAIDDPFAAVERVLAEHSLKRGVDAILVDMHAEATSEKMSMGHVLDGRVSLVAGTHSHVPTADAHVMARGTAYITDLGMCGDYDSVIGMQKKTATARFTKKLPTERLEPAEGEATFCAVYVETDDATGLARRIAPVRLGGRLAEAWPI